MNIMRLAMSVVAAAAVSVSAATVRVYPPRPGELGHREILDALYGGSFSAQDVDYVNGGLTGAVSAIRQEDFLFPMGVMSLTAGDDDSAADALWTDGSFTAFAVARYATEPHQFGFDRGSGYEHLLTATGTGVNVSEGTSMDLTAETWSWVLEGTGCQGVFYSEPQRNSDRHDHMVTYRIDGLDRDGATWLLFWEDEAGFFGLGSDRDFNDLVVEVRTAPEPASVAMMILGGLVMLVRRSPLI
jgi:hypothetical protein